MTHHVLDDDPMLIAHHGRLCWQFDNGRIMPVVRGGDDPDPEPKTFSQADLDRIVADRLARVKAEPPADYAQLQAAATELAALKATAKKAEDDRLSADEKTTNKIAELEASIQKANDAVAAAKSEAQTEKVRATIIAEAMKQKAVDPSDIVALLPKDAVTIGDDGQVTGAEAAIKSLLEAKPHLVGPTAPLRPKPDPGQGKTGDAKDFGAAGLAEARKRFGTPVAAQQQQ